MRINKTIIVYSSIIVSLILLLILSLNNLFPVAVQHTLSYCQAALKVPSQILLSGIVIILLLPWLKLIFIAYKTLLFRKRLKFSKMEQEVNFLATKYNLHNKVLVFNSPKAYAFCLGIKKPNIYLSTKIIKMMNKKELEAVILHEKYHLENQDNISLLLLSFAKQFLVMFPVFSDILENFIIKKEIEADQAAIIQLGSKKDLISAFIKLIKSQHNIFPATSYFSEPSTIESRINVLLNKHSHLYSYKLRNIGISVLSLVALLIIMWAPVYKTEVHAKDRDEIMICLNKESCGVMCSSNTLPPMSHM